MVGILPGAGGNIAAFLSYTEAKRADRDPDSFGKGNPKGVAAAEAGNSSDNAASLIPTLTLGVPGNAIAALIMGGLLVHGLQPGPSLFRDNGEIVYGFVLQMMITSVLLFALGGIVATRIFAQVLRVPQVMLAPMIVALMCLGLYTVNNSQFELFMMIGFAIFGYVLMKMEFPLPPMILGVILGGMAEQNLRTALLISRGDWWHLLASPISKAIAALVVLVLLVPLYRLWRNRRAEASASECAPARVTPEWQLTENAPGYC
jgi:putative tricarboxylic transport membrane protein